MQRTSLTVWALALFPVVAFVLPQSHLLAARRRLAPTFVGSLAGSSPSGVGISASASNPLDDDADEEEEEELGARGSSAAFTVEPHEAGVRLDVFLAARVAGQSRSYLAALIAQDHVRDARSGRAATKKAGKVKRGDTLAVTFALNELFTIVAEDIPLDIIYEDEVRIVLFVLWLGLCNEGASPNGNGSLLTFFQGLKSFKT